MSILDYYVAQINRLLLKVRNMTWKIPSFGMKRILPLGVVAMSELEALLEIRKANITKMLACYNMRIKTGFYAIGVKRSGKFPFFTNPLPPSSAIDPSEPVFVRIPPDPIPRAWGHCIRTLEKIECIEEGSRFANCWYF